MTMERHVDIRNAPLTTTKLLSVDDVSESLGVPKSTIRYWCFTKRISYYKIGRHLKIEKSELEKFLESNLVERR